MSNCVGVDTETFLIGPGQILPKLVCISAAEEGSSDVFAACEGSTQALVKCLLDDVDLVGLNIAYDLGVIARAYPQFLPKIFRAYDEGKIHDVRIIEKLICLGTHGDLSFGPGGDRLSFSLEALAYRRCGIKLGGKEGDDVWRLRYHELDGVPSAEYPTEAFEYARQDAVAAREIYLVQKRKYPDLIPLEVERLHTKLAFDLMLKTAWGVKIDRAKKEQIQAKVEAELTPDKMRPLYSAGILRPPQGPRPHARGAKEHRTGCSRKNCTCPAKMTQSTGETVNLKELEKVIAQVCETNNLEVKLTKKGNVARDAEWLGELGSLSPELDLFHHRAELQKLVTSYFPAMEWEGETATTIYPNYDPLKKTGRVSSSGFRKGREALYPSLNIQQAPGRGIGAELREVYVPREGNVFVSADVTALELCSAAQRIYQLNGFSTHMEQINKGIDPHAFLGCVLAYHEDREFHSAVRGLSDEKAYDEFLRRKHTSPEWYKHFRNYAKPVGLGFPGGMGLVTMCKVAKNYGFSITPKVARRLKRIWLSVYPEFRWYLQKWVEEQEGTYYSPLGMKRAGCSYTELANGNALQTPGAEGMKEASWLVTKACYLPGSVLYGCRPVINMHDELVVEIPDDELKHERAMEIRDLMVQGLRRIMPDVTITVEPVLSRRWSKRAEPVYVDGRLEVWEGRRDG